MINSPARVLVARYRSLDPESLDFSLARPAGNLMPLGDIAHDPRLSESLGELNEYLHERVTCQMTDVGSAYSVSIESVAALDPDLILAPSENTDLPVDVLSEVAPVVVAPHDDSGDWRAASEVYADAVGRSNEIAATLADYDDASPRCARA